MGPANARRNQRIANLKAQGLGQREIARGMGLSPNVVAGVLHRLGLTDSTSRYAIHTLRSDIDPAFKLAVMDAARSLGNAAEAARQWGVSPWALCDWLRQARARSAPTPNVGEGA